MASHGNEAARATFESKVPPFYYRPTFSDCPLLREQWIRAKYERQEFLHVEKQEPYSAGYREGLLWKRGRDNGQFLSRKFVLTEREGALKYFNKNDAKEPKAVMKIEHLNATFQPGKIGHPHGLQVTYLKDNSTRNIFIYHEDGKEIVDWFNALRAARFHYLQVAFPGASDADVSDCPRATCWVREWGGSHWVGLLGSFSRYVPSILGLATLSCGLELRGGPWVPLSVFWCWDEDPGSRLVTWLQGFGLRSASVRTVTSALQTCRWSTFKIRTPSWVSGMTRAPHALAGQWCPVRPRPLGVEGWSAGVEVHLGPADCSPPSPTHPQQTEGFRKRWFTMDDRRLMYFKDPLDAFARGEVFIGSKESGYTVLEGLPPSTQGHHWPHGITIVTPDRKFLFTCETEADQREWIAAFQKVVDRPMLPQEYAVEAHFKHKP
nr:arf-GAP with dual PH domain-containing protein 1 [Peromyscus maniculatus bairdii]